MTTESHALAELARLRQAMREISAVVKVVSLRALDAPPLTRSAMLGMAVVKVSRLADAALRE